MKKKLHIIYVPGLGDDNPQLQARAIALWGWYGVTSELVHIHWSDSESWDDKFQRLLERIDQASERGQKVGLVGASAGAGAVINAYAARKDQVVGAVCIAGKVLHPSKIGDSYRQRSSAFVDSAYQAPEALEKLSPGERRRILSRFSLVDVIVPARDSRIPGAVNRRVPGFSHVLTIALQITLGAPSFIAFLKCQQAA